MYRALAVEDNTTQLTVIQQDLTKHFPDISIVPVSSFSQANFHIINPHEYFDFFLLDIDLGEDGEHSGITLAHNIRSQSRYSDTPILFLTGFIKDIQTAQNTFHCTNYLLKPYNTDTLCRSVSALFQAPIGNVSIILADEIGLNTKIKASDIFYAESNGKGILIHTIQGDFSTRRYTLTQLETQFHSSPVFRCHKRYLVNQNSIARYDKGKSILYLQTAFDEFVPISVGTTYCRIVNERMSVKNYVRDID